jgi:hypothetical protein
MVSKPSHRNDEESEFTARICDEVRAIGGRTLVIAGSSRFQPPGLPDRVIFWKTFTMFVEFKASNGVLRKDQKLKHQMMNTHRITTLVCRAPGHFEWFDGNWIQSFDGTGRGFISAIEDILRRSGQL